MRHYPAGAPIPHAAGASALLHATILLAFLWAPPWRSPDPPPQASVEVQLVRQSDARKGAPDPATETDAATPSDPSPPASASDAAPIPASAPALSPEPAPATRPPPPSAASRQSDGSPPMPTPLPPSVNLGSSDEDREALSITGDNVVSEGPDSRYHNMPPYYPADAARAGLQGAVSLLIHITATGAAGEIEIVGSSGIASMDEAARAAVARWRFKPPLRNGAPVRSVYLLRFNFLDQPP